MPPSRIEGSATLTARSRNSLGYFLGAGTTPPFRGFRPSTNPGALALPRHPSAATEGWHVEGPPRHRRNDWWRVQELEEVPMAIVGGFDVHRAQITFDYLDPDTGEVATGQIRPATRAVLRSWLGDRFAGRDGVAFAVEGCTGWRFVVEEMLAAGVEPHLAEPADTATLRGRKKRAKTDRTDARLLAGKRLPESWIPPHHVVEVR